MSTIAARLTEDMKIAMRAKDSVALNVVRNLKSAIKYAAIEKFGAEGELDDADVMSVIRKEIKKRNDSITQFESANRSDLAEVEKAEVAVLEKYLPAGLTQEEMEALVDAAIAETGATTKKDMGKVMKLVQERSEGRADGKALSAAVTAKLSA